MNTQRPQFDSHRFVKRLTMAGLSEEVAEILADEHTNLIVPGDVATRADVEALGTRLDSARAEMATKAETAIKAATDTKADVGALGARLDIVEAEMTTKEFLRRELAARDARLEQCLQNAILEAKISLIKWMIATTITSMAVFSGVVIGAVTALQ